MEQAQLLVAGGRPAEAVPLLRSALDLWRGPALSGLVSSTMAPVVLRLDEQHIATAERLAALRLQLGEAGSLVDELVELVSAHPFREPLRSSLIIALHRAGRQAEALSVYEEARQLFAEEFGADPGEPLLELHAQILRGELPSAPEPVRPASSPGPPPDDIREPDGKFFLPHDTMDFTGRADEILQLTRQVQPENTTALVISAVEGMGGIGKTALVVHLAHQLGADYPEGQYFIDLRGFTAGMEPMSPAQALYDLLRDSGVPAELVPHDVDRRSALWRSRIAAKSVILVLDNAMDVAQVRPLLPGTAGALVLVTSRRRLPSLEGAFSLSLETLPPTDAVGLFRQIAGSRRLSAQDEGVAAVVELCGRLPLAIRIAAARFRDRHSWTVADLIAQLQTQKRRTRFLSAGDRDVNTVLAVSYRHLHPDQQKLFRMLSLHPGSDFDLYAVAALVDISVEEAENGLEQLFDDSLLFQRNSGRYSFHDLVRDCAHALSEEHESPATREEALDRLLDYYLVAANHWSRRRARGPFVFDPVVTHRPAAYPTGDDQTVAGLLAAEHQNLIAALDLADGTDRLDRLWQLALSLQPALSARNYSAAVPLFDKAVRAARKIGNRFAESAALTGLALAHWKSGSIDEAQHHLEEAIEVSREMGEPRFEAEQLNCLGGTQMEASRISAGFTSFSQALRLVDRSADPILYAALLNNLGVVCRDLGRYPEALDYFKQARDSGEGQSSDLEQAQTMVNIGAVLHFEGRHEAAVDLFVRALIVFRSSGSRRGQAVALMCLAMVRRALTDMSGALSSGREALGLARADGLREIECETMLVLCEIYLSMGEVETASHVLEQAEASAVEHGYQRHISHAYEVHAHVAVACGDLAAARSHWQRALDLCPADLAQAEYARHHLAVTDLVEATCLRCWTRLTDE